MEQKQNKTKTHMRTINVNGFSSNRDYTQSDKTRIYLLGF